MKHHVALSVVGTERLRGQRLLPRQDGAGEADPGQRDPLHDRPLDAVLRVPGRHRPVGHRRARSCACSPASCSRSPPTTWPTRWPTSPSSAPANGIVEIAGPERVRLSDIVGRFLEATSDPRKVVASRDARYFGYELDDRHARPGRPRAHRARRLRGVVPPVVERSRRRSVKRTAEDRWLHPLGDRPLSGSRQETNMIRSTLAAALVAAVPATAISAQDASEDKLPVTVVFDQELPNVPGKSMRGVLVEYEPGRSSPAHTHPRSAFIYATVLEGAIRSQVNDGPATTYRAGESWSDFPGIGMPSARTPARRSPRACSRCSSSTPTRRRWSHPTRNDLAAGSCSGAARDNGEARGH